MSMGHRSGQNASGLFTFGLVALFALLSLLLTVIGINVYQKVMEATEVNNQARASLSYIANKIRAGDEEGLVTLRTWEEIPVLVIQDPEMPEYDLSFYYYNGTLMEQHVQAGEDFYPDQGEALVQLQSFSMETEAPDLFRFSVGTEDGSEFTLHVALRTAMEGGES